MGMAFIDTHCHFDFPPFNTQENTSLAMARSHGVRRIIVPSVSVTGFDTVVALAQRHEMLSAALGIHPWYSHQHGLEDVERLAYYAQIGREQLVAIGEIGLDLYMENPQLEQQMRLLQAQLKLAKAYELPVILHSGRTHEKLTQALKQARLPRRGVVHGFSGSLVQAQAFVKLGYFIGVGGTITYTRARKTRQVIAELPLQVLLLESDAPNMPLAGYQGEPNRPERVVQVFNTLCQLRSEPAVVIMNALLENSIALFGHPLQT